MKSTVICPKCKKYSEKGANFCHYCGNSLNQLIRRNERSFHISESKFQTILLLAKFENISNSETSFDLDSVCYTISKLYNINYKKVKHMLDLYDLGSLSIEKLCNSIKLNLIEDEQIEVIKKLYEFTYLRSGILTLKKQEVIYDIINQIKLPDNKLNIIKELVRDL